MAEFVDTDSLASRIGAEMLVVEDSYVDGLRTRARDEAVAAGAQRRDAAAAMGAVADNVVLLYDEMGLSRSR